MANRRNAGNNGGNELHIPLLASEEGGDRLLSAGPTIIEDADDDTNSPLSRLITKSTALMNEMNENFSMMMIQKDLNNQQQQQYHTNYDYGNDPNATATNTNNTLLTSTMSNTDAITNNRTTTIDHDMITSPSTLYRRIATLLFTVLFWCFLWAAYVNDNWASTHVLVSLGWQEEYAPILDGITDAQVKEVGLISTTHDLQTADSTMLIVALWISYIMLPCLFLVFIPFWIYNDIEQEQNDVKCNTYSSMNKKVTHSQRHQLMLSTMTNNRSYLRCLLEFLLRFALLVYFIVIFLDLGTSYIQMNWKYSYMNVYNTPETALISYLLALIFATTTTIILRMNNNVRFYNTIIVSSSSSNDDDEIKQQQHIVVNPNNNDGGAVEMITRSPRRQELEQIDNNKISNSSSTTTTTTTKVINKTVHVTSLSLWKRFILLQIGLMIIILLYPSYFSDYLFSIKYTGLASEFMFDNNNYNHNYNHNNTHTDNHNHVHNNELFVKFYQIPFMLYDIAVIQANTPLWKLAIVAMPLAVTVYMLPILLMIATFFILLKIPFSTTTRPKPHTSRNKSTNNNDNNNNKFYDNDDNKLIITLYNAIVCLHPVVNGVCFSVSCVSIIPSIQTIAHNVLNAGNGTFAICDQIKLHDSLDICIALNGIVLPGTYYLLLQSILLDIWIFITLYWMKQNMTMKVIQQTTMTTLEEIEHQQESSVAMQTTRASADTTTSTVMTSNTTEAASASAATTTSLPENNAIDQLPVDSLGSTSGVTPQSVATTTTEKRKCRRKNN